MEGVIIGLDFDGTCACHEFPEIGQEVPYCIDVLKKMQAAGAKIVLNTMRSDMPERKYLTEAVEWLKERGIELYGVNNNPDQNSWTSSPKVYANIYIDDAALGAPVCIPEGFTQRVIDWQAIDRVTFFKP